MRAKIILAVHWEAVGVLVNFVTSRGVFCVVQVLLARSVILRISITWMRKLGYVLIACHVNVVQWVKYRLLVFLNWSTRRRSAKRTSICRTSAYSSGWPATSSSFCLFSVLRLWGWSCLGFSSSPSSTSPTTPILTCTWVHCSAGNTSTVSTSTSQPPSPPSPRTSRP